MIVPSRSVAISRGRLSNRLKAIHIQEGAKRLRHRHRTILVLMILKDRNDHPGDGNESAIEGGYWFRALTIFHADIESARLELGAIRSRSHLTKGALRRDPRFTN